MEATRGLNHGTLYLAEYVNVWACQSVSVSVYRGRHVGLRFFRGPVLLQEAEHHLTRAHTQAYIHGHTHI